MVFLVPECGDWYGMNEVHRGKAKLVVHSREWILMESAIENILWNW